MTIGFEYRMLPMRNALKFLIYDGVPDNKSTADLKYGKRMAVKVISDLRSASRVKIFP